MRDQWISIGDAKDKRELKKILNDIRLKGVKIKIKDILKESKPEHKEYWKMRFKSGLEKRYSVNVKSSYWGK